ncbi:uncharacterized protein N7473_002492 [Penicillium subrubescens]|jgi:hypothetical protein|uniref:Uncharacterized protein n=1 Tax=Penicillium subrubescens TaxID=1316194 RepID=A0A1Q5UK65_9EURO|nr:uncharacterized protein N7473_002492 [Penicillium subrubescens]KAJ5905576.1 hypothetical protein N7473_002492 [Penicillium subrubescens]OKP12871.1 hypothetical protein PENSUB_1603 [Penicillium subrubescens]
MALKTIFLMGAPLPSSLDWENDELLNSPIQPFSSTDTIHEHDTSIVQSGDPIKWRVLQPPLTEHPTGYHEYYRGPEDPSFLTTHKLVEADNESMKEDSILSEFYDHSFVVHETSEISTTGLQDEESTQESEPALACIDAAATGTTAEVNNHELPRSLQISGPIRDLQHLPTASYLQSIAPQTMTVNLIVGIIAIHPPRRVVTRQWKTELDIIELIVGDENRTGFGVNIWLPASTSISCKTQEADRLSRSLATLRPRDIILLRTVGLSSFRDQVYGQSLRGGMTKVDLLYRQPVDVTDTVGFYKSGLRRNSPQDHADLPLQKTRRVREWIVQFVGATDEAGGGPSRMSQTQRGHQRLPPDTQ